MARSVRLIGAVLLLALPISGCAMNTRSTGTGTATLSQAAVPATGPLTKAQFIQATNAVCAATDTKISNFPRATGNDDYPALISDFSSTITVYQSYFAEVTPLVERSPDRVNLTKKWLDVEKSDFAASLPILQQLVQALQAKNGDAITAGDKKLKAAPDHTSQLIKFFQDYGLSACSAMQSNS